MKKILNLFCLLCTATITIVAQNVFPTVVNTNVGIGTVTPSTRLQITSATAGTSGLRLTNLTSISASVAGNSKALSVDTAGNIILTPVLNTIPVSNNIYNLDGILSSNRNITMAGNNLLFNASTENSQFFINGVSGKVGIGMINPTAKLDINGDIKANVGIFTNSLPDGQFFANLPEAFRKSIVFGAGKLMSATDGFDARSFTIYDIPVSNFHPKSKIGFTLEDRSYKARFNFFGDQNGGSNLTTYNKNQEIIMDVNEDGNDNVKFTLPKANSFLGIGTTSFTDGVDIYKLSVAGNVRANRVKVYTTWADYVFEKNYYLPTLEEVEKHIKNNGHLKDIPSAKEVEENGIDLGEMNKKLLLKIEELTLYLIDLKKELNTIKLQINNK